MVTNCTSYGPMLIDLVYHQAIFHPRYKDLMRKYFSYPISDTKSDTVYVGWDAIAEDTNLQCGQFCHKQQSLEQTVLQSQIVDRMNEQLHCLKKNLSTKESANTRSMKDDRDIKSRLIASMINFKLFQIQENHALMNEFAANQSSDILQHSQNRPTGDRWLKF